MAEARAVLQEALRLYRLDPGLALHRAAEAVLLRGLRLHGPVLDLGCHDGAFSWLALRAAALHTHFIGSDCDVAGLARCRDRRVHRDVIVSDAARLPFRDRLFGSVVCNSFLTHMDELPAALGEIARVLAPGGVLVATVPTPAFHALFGPERALRALGLHGAARRVARTYDDKWHQRHLLSEADWRATLQVAGLELEAWTEYLGPRGSLLWSSLFVLTRTGSGRLTVGALLRRLFPGGAPWSGWLERRLCAWLAPALQPERPGGSALLVARRRAP